MTGSTDSDKAVASTVTGASGRDPPSMALRWAVNILSLVGVFFFSGIIYGFAPLQLILMMEEGQYGGFCEDEQHQPCDEQLRRLGAIFTVGQFYLSFTSLPVGFLLDSLPKNVYFLIAGIINVAGLLLFAYSDTTFGADRDYFQPAYSLMSLGGCMAMLGGFPPSFLLPKYQAAILAALSCFFDASSIVFYAFYKIIIWFDDGSGDAAKYQGEEGGYNPTAIRQQLFMAWAALAAIVFAALSIFWTVLERTDWKGEIEIEDSEDGSEDETQEDQKHHHHLDDDEREALIENNVNWGASLRSSPLQKFRKKQSSLLDDHRLRRSSMRIQQLQTHPFLKMLWTVDFGFAALFASISMLRCNFFILTVDNFLWNLGDTDNTYASIFSWMLPAGLLFVPFIDGTHHHWGVLNTLRVTNACGLVFGALLLVPQLNVQVVNFLVFTCFRAYLYSTLSTLIAETFGLEPMGRVIGSMYFVAAVASLLQVPMSVTTQSVFNGNYYPVSLLNLFLALIPVVTLEWYDRWEKGRERQRQREEQKNLKNTAVGYGSVVP